MIPYSLFLLPGSSGRPRPGGRGDDDNSGGGRGYGGGGGRDHGSSGGGGPIISVNPNREPPKSNKVVCPSCSYSSSEVGTLHDH